MLKLKRFATNSPIQFGILITLAVWLLYLTAGIFAAIITQERVGNDIIEALGRLAASFLFLYLLGQFGWLDVTGVTRPGTPGAWLVTLLIILYEIIMYQLPLFGDLVFQVSNPGISISIGVNALVTGLLEELPFRGIILYAFLRVWGNSRKGIVQSVLLSAVLFSGSHFIHVALGKPFGAIAMKLVMTFLSSIYYAALVLRWKTIWTAVLLHGVLNAFVSIRAIEIPGFTETATALSTIIILQVPLVVFGVILVSKIPPRNIAPEASQG